MTETTMVLEERYPRGFCLRDQIKRHRRSLKAALYLGLIAAELTGLSMLLTMLLA